MRNVYDYYITPEEYEQAESLGIDGQTVDRRIRQLGWSKKRAISTPIRPLSKDRSYWREIAERNGISFSAFHSRISRGWSDQEAALTPIQTPEERRIQALAATEKVRKFPAKYLRMAERNGIPYHTFRMRVVKSGWTLEEAATRPIMSRNEIGKRGAKALRDREGDWAAQIFGRR